MKTAVVWTFVLCLAFSPIFGSFPTFFYGNDVRAPVTEFEETLLHTFGTYHDELDYHYRAQRFCALDANHTPLSRTRLQSLNGQDWSYHRSESYTFDEAGRLSTIVETDENGNHLYPIMEYWYDGDTSIIDSITFPHPDYQWCRRYEYYHDPQTAELDSVVTYYFSYGDSTLLSGLLNTYTWDQYNQTTGWVGKCYSIEDEIYSTGDFTWDAQNRLDTYRYETPATREREHVILRGILNWEGNRLTGITHLDEFQDEVTGNSVCDYDSDGRIVAVSAFWDDNPTPGFVNTFDYDEHGRMISQIDYSYNYDGTLNHAWKTIWEYPVYTGTSNSETPNPAVRLHAAPNPFNPETTIHFTLGRSGRTRLEIYNIMGQRVALLMDEVREVGSHMLSWQANDVPSGVYFARLQQEGETVTTQRLILLK